LFSAGFPSPHRILGPGGYQAAALGWAQAGARCWARSRGRFDHQPSTSRGKEIILADFGSGELFGEIALLDGKPRSASVVALTNCELMFLERRNVIPFLERNPAARMKLMEMLCARIRRSDERMSDIAFFNLPIRLAKALLNYQPEARVGMKISLSQSELAEMAGGTREKVNRCLRDWQRQGIIELKNRWTIIGKPEALRALIESM
jgi:CRP-like cAMP-binding protein